MNKEEYLMNKDEYLEELLELEKVVIYRMELTKDRIRGLKIQLKNTIRDYEDLLDRVQKEIRANDKRKSRNWWNIFTL